MASRGSSLEPPPPPRRSTAAPHHPRAGPASSRVGFLDRGPCLRHDGPHARVLILRTRNQRRGLPAIWESHVVLSVPPVGGRCVVLCAFVGDTCGAAAWRTRDTIRCRASDNVGTD